MRKPPVHVAVAANCLGMRRRRSVQRKPSTCARHVPLTPPLARRQAW
ncbi:MAG: hypothetical protein QOG35_317 [Solirubrobacteraceae bacterium]|nr:hypothetical protein [Solirubrobacteraceae bacterium]